MSEEEEAPESSGCAGAAVIAAAVLVAVFGTYAISRTAFIGLVWIIGAWAIIRAARKPVAGTPDPAPPAPPERGSEEKPQVRMIRDTGHPNRWVVAAPSPWMGVEINKEAGTT